MVDYSKWKDIEVSDDEDDTHPNIDTPSLFRWRHTARLERMAEKDKENEKLQSELQVYEQEVTELKKKLETKVDDKDELQQKLSQLELKKKVLNKKQAEFKKKEALEPWNIDTISKEGFSKTVINNPAKGLEVELTEEEKDKKMQIFIKKNEKLIKSYGMFKNYDDSRRFLQDHPDLTCEETANYLVIWCINLEMEEKSEFMDHVAHQAICMQFILELARELDRDPRSCVSAFFHRIQQAEPVYKRAFDDELSAFKDRVKKRAAQKIEEAIKEAEEEERKARLGPGGLDPIEVMESLPEELKKCFESQDTALLTQTIEHMDKDDAAYHMKRCVDSGLWVLPDSDKNNENSE